MNKEALYLFETFKKQYMLIYNHPYTLDPVHSLVIINKNNKDYWYQLLNNQVRQGRIMPGFEHLFIQVR